MKYISHWKSIPLNKGVDLNFNIKTYFHLDSGSNVHIINNKLHLVNFKSSHEDLEQISGNTTPICGHGYLLCLIGGIYYLLKDVKYMPTNPNCTISTGSLKRNDGFVTSSHDVGTSVTLRHRKHHPHHLISNKDNKF